MNVSGLLSLLIESIYAAAIDVHGWESALVGIRDAFRAEVVVLWRRLPSPERDGAVAALGLPADAEGGMARRGRARDPHVQAVARLSPGAVEPLSAIVPLGVAIFGDMPAAWRKALDDEGGLVVGVLREGADCAALELVRKKGDAPFEGDAYDLARSLAPHLARALLIERDLEYTRARSAAAVALRERLPLGVILVDRHARVLECSRRASVILEAGDGLRTVDGRLSAARNAETSRLHQLIEHAAQARPAMGVAAGVSLLVERPSQRRPLAIEVSPVAADDAVASRRDRQVLVYVRDPDRGTELSTEALRRVYGLTRTEADVTSLIARGMNHSDAARELGVTVCAVRFHLKSIYAKTATQRQAELVYLLASGTTQLTA